MAKKSREKIAKINGASNEAEPVLVDPKEDSKKKKSETKKASSKLKRADAKKAKEKSEKKNALNVNSDKTNTVSSKNSDKKNSDKKNSDKKNSSKKNSSKNPSNSNSASEKDLEKRDAGKMNSERKSSRNTSHKHADDKSIRSKNGDHSGGKNHKAKLAKIHDFLKPYRVTDGKSFKLSDFDPADVGSFDRDTGKEQAQYLLSQGIELLSEMQDVLYAQDRQALLLIFQAMDAAGKDGTIKHVMSGVNPQGCQVFSFKQPSDEELDHDYLWRYMRCLPERGRIGIYNRSYYEEVLVVRVHESILAKQKLPKYAMTKNIWNDRLEDISSFERYLCRNGVKVLKFFLNVSKKEQKKRFISRLEQSDKHWKFSMSDISERKFWDDYMSAYTEAIRKTATKDAPWYVVPADNKWFSRLVVAAAIVDTLKGMDLKYPEVDEAKMKEIEQVRHSLIESKDEL